jgi:reactive chlorine resistance protein C
MATTTQDRIALSRMLEVIGMLLMRYGLVLILFWIGLMKFTPYEANAIKPLVEHSPFMGWMYHVMSVQAASNAIGIIEVATAVLMALQPWSAIASVIGSTMAVFTFLLTLSFLFSTPGWEPTLGGFPALSVAPGQFLLKDLLLLGAALWSLGDSLRKINHRRHRPVNHKLHSAK